MTESGGAAVRYLLRAGRGLSPRTRVLGATIVASGIAVMRWLSCILHRIRAPWSGIAPVDPKWASDPGSCVALHEFDGFECVEVAPEFGEPHYALLAAVLQCGPRSKLLDLRRAQVVRPDLFTELTKAWRAPADTVPRLGILIAYDRWAILREGALRQLQPIAERGTAVEMFYEQQPDVARWFERGDRVRHDPAAVVLWLSTEWPTATAVWPAVLNATARLVDTEAGASAPELLIDLGVIALAIDAADAAAHASKHFYAALARLGDTPSSARARALRLLAMAQRASDPMFARALLAKAVSIADVAKDRVEGAHALADLATLARASGQPWRAARRLRDALILLPSDAEPRLRSFLHHELMIALHQQSLLRTERAARAVYHVSEIYGLRTAEDS